MAGKPGVQLVLRDSFPAIQLCNPTSNSCIDVSPIFKQPPILLFLSFEKMDQRFFYRRGARRLNLLPDAGFERWIVNLDLHGSIVAVAVPV